MNYQNAADVLPTKLFLRNDGKNLALADSSFEVNDGRHRLEMYRQLGVYMFCHG